MVRIMIPQRQRKTLEPCAKCGLHALRCLCAEIPRLSLATRVTLVIHANELKRTTNTGRLAIHALENSEMRVRGLEHEAQDLSALLNPAYETLFLYPSENAVELNAALVSRLTKPAHLIVPDGNWRQAGKVHYRHKELAHVQRVTLKRPLSVTEHLRAESSEDGMATLQAIAIALGVLEGDAVGARLEALYELKLRRTLEGRGSRPPANVIRRDDTEHS
jgi:DTW domain-containing protein YfiP